MSFDYLALIVGGEGPDVWDKEESINAADFMDAAGQAQAKADEWGGQVVMLEQNDTPPSPWKADIDAQTSVASAGDPGLF